MHQSQLHHGTKECSPNTRPRLSVPRNPAMSLAPRLSTRCCTHRFLTPPPHSARHAKAATLQTQARPSNPTLSLAD
eukprot:87253-Alexandrium_andersonii.AAC.1